MRTETTSEEFFEAKYQEAADPWNFAGSRYEQDRYATIIAALRDRQFKSAFEPGCSIGVLTERLARHCERVEAMDIPPRLFVERESNVRIYRTWRFRTGRCLRICLKGASI